ncbi:MAG TPA: cytochrome c [Blastocatellia bacterium]|nr:cytochrome c [Blastocatellia bacterium]
MNRAPASGKRLRAACLLIFAFCLLPFALNPVAAHEPVTTKVRFNKELVRVFQRNCLGCHRPGGMAMSLATYEEARPWAKAIKEEILEKRMPPWRAMKGYGEFRNAPTLTQREIDLIVNWVEGGAPKGEDKDLPAGPLYSDDWQLGKPDLILKPDAASKIAADAEEHRAITLETNLKEDRWITAIDLRPGNGSIVRSASFYIDGGRVKESENTNSQFPNTGPCFSTWMPGQKTVALPEGIAQPLPAGSRIVARINYRTSGEAAEDRSEVGIYFAKTPPRKQLLEISITNADAAIPAGAEFHQVKASFTMQEDAEAVMIRPAVNPLVISHQATAYRPDGSEEVMIWTRGYGFEWQQTYYFKRPVALPKGTRIEVIAYFDNSDGNRNNPNSPPKQLRWADLSPDPLCSLSVARTRTGND